MNGMRKVLCFVMALGLAVFALPSVAGDNGKKIYSLDMAIMSAPPAAPPYTVKATITNEGNSTINSFRIFVTGLTVVGVNQPAAGNATFTGSSVSVKNMPPLKAGQSFPVTISVNSCGDGAWGASVWTGSSLNGQTFDLVLADSNLATSISCGNLASGAAFTVPDSINANCVTGQRGYYDKDGSIPAGALPFFVTNTVPINGQLHFRWPDNNTGDPAAVFEYAICGTGPLPPPGVAKVAWLNVDTSPASTPGTPAFITAQDCNANANFLPAPYGTLWAYVGVDATTITVNALTPTGLHGSIVHPLPPFDIVIGTERMTVTAVSSDDGPGGDLSDPSDSSEGEVELETWTVTRHVAFTDPATHTSGQLAMSTPLPILPAGTHAPYVAGHQAQMCIAAEQQSEGPNVTHSTTLIDVGDGWTSDP